MVNGFIVTVLGCRPIVATLGTLSIFRGIDYLIAGPPPGAAGRPARRASPTPPYDSILGIPIFVLVDGRDRRRRDGRAALDRGSGGRSTPSAATRRRRRSWASRRGASSSRAYALCGLLAGVAGVMWVIQFGTINGTAATGVVLAVVAAVVVGGVNIFGGSGTLIGAALGAYFLGFVANALILVGLSQFWLQAIYGVVILGRDQRGRAHPRGACSATAAGRRPDDRDADAPAAPAASGLVAAGARALGDAAARRRSSG